MRRDITASMLENLEIELGLPDYSRGSYLLFRKTSVYI